MRRRQELERLDEGRVEAPTEEWVREQFGHLETLLRSGVPAAAHALRDLVGGEIILTEVERPGYHRNFLQGRFTLKTRSLIEAMGNRSEGLDSVVSAGTSAEHGEEIVIDFCEPDPIETLAERAKELWDAGKRYREIAAELHCSVKRVRRAMKHWFETRGLPRPDGRKSPSGYWPSKKPPAALVERVKNLKDQGLEIGQIALQVCHSRGYVAKLLTRWYEERGLQVPDWRRRCT